MAGTEAINTAKYIDNLNKAIAKMKEEAVREERRE